MFSSRFFRRAYRVFSSLKLEKSAKSSFSQSIRIGTISTSLALFSFSTAMCNTDIIGEINVGHVDDITEGTMKKVQIGENEENFILLSKVNGKIYATGGKCSHYGAPLQMGYLDGYSVICPWHAAAFDVRTGELIQSPGQDAIPTYNTIIKQGRIFVSIPESKMKSVAGSHPSKKLVKRDLTNKTTFVVVGGGAAGNAAVETLRREGFTGRIVLITSEKLLPYDRVQLSKNFKVDNTKLVLRDQSFYDQYDIEVHTDAEVLGVNENNKTVKLKNGKEVGFDKLLLSTGCGARVPGPYRHLLTTFSNVFTIRSADDHQKIKGSLADANDVVIIGAGFLGLEAAASIKRTWPEKNITIVDLEEKPLASILGSEIAGQVIAAQRSNGVNFVLGSKISAFNGEDGKIRSLTLPTWTTYSGRPTTRDLKADLVLFATGAELKTSYAPVSLLNTDGSIRVNSHLQTENSSIYAAGDIAQFPSILTESRERVEHWAVAQQQGRIAALNMIEKGNNYLDVPFFWTNQFVNVQFAGFSAGHDWTFTETKDEDLPTKTARITYFYKGENCIGIAAVNWPGAVLRLKIALSRGLMPSRKELTSKAVNYAKILEKVKNSNPCGPNCCKN